MRQKWISSFQAPARENKTSVKQSILYQHKYKTELIQKGWLVDWFLAPKKYWNALEKRFSPTACIVILFSAKKNTH